MEELIKAVLNESKRILLKVNYDKLNECGKKRFKEFSKVLKNY